MRGHPPGAVIGQGAPRDETVHVEVRVEELVPGMEDHDATQWAAEVVPPALAQRLTGGCTQEAEQQPFMTQDERVEAVRQCKDGVKVRDRAQCGLASSYPWGFGEALALGTVPIAARVVGIALEAARRPLLDVSTKLGRATGGDGLQDPLRARGDGRGLPIAVAIEPDDVSHCPAGWGGFCTGGSHWATTMSGGHGLTPRRGAVRPRGS
jgi:hypothetical protein